MRVEKTALHTKTFCKRRRHDFDISSVNHLEIIEKTERLQRIVLHSRMPQTHTMTLKNRYFSIFYWKNARTSDDHRTIASASWFVRTSNLQF